MANIINVDFRNKTILKQESFDICMETAIHPALLKLKSYGADLDGLEDYTEDLISFEHMLNVMTMGGATVDKLIITYNDKIRDVLVSLSILIDGFAPLHTTGVLREFIKEL